MPVDCPQSIQFLSFRSNRLGLQVRLISFDLQLWLNLSPTYHPSLPLLEASEYLRTGSYSNYLPIYTPVCMLNMASTENAVNPQTGKEKWLAYIDEEIDEIGASSPVETELLVLLRKLLLSDCSTAQIAYAAQKIDACYVNTYLGLDPLQKFSEDKGMGNYIATVYLTIFNLACVVSYEDFRHDVLVQLICELRNIPPKPFKIWGVSSTFYKISH